MPSDIDISIFYFNFNRLRNSVFKYHSHRWKKSFFCKIICRLSLEMCKYGQLWRIWGPFGLDIFSFYLNFNRVDNCVFTHHSHLWPKCLFLQNFLPSKCINVLIWLVLEKFEGSLTSILATFIFILINQTNVYSYVIVIGGKKYSFARLINV